MAKTVWKIQDDGSSYTDIWDYDTGADTYGVVVDTNGNVYIAGDRSSNKSVWKLDSSGSLVWDYDTGGNTKDIDVDAAGNVYVVGDRVSSKSVWKLDSNGDLDWDYDTGGDTKGVYAKSGIYVAGAKVSSVQVWSLSDSGSLNWGWGNTSTLAAYDVEKCYGGISVAMHDDASLGSHVRLSLGGAFQCYNLPGGLANGVVGGVLKIKTIVEDSIVKIQTIDDGGIIKAQVVTDRILVCFANTVKSVICYNTLCGGVFDCGADSTIAYGIDMVIGALSYFVAFGDSNSLRKYDFNCTLNWQYTAVKGYGVTVNADGNVYLVGERDTS